MKRRHSHRNELAWKKQEEVRYFLGIGTEIIGDVWASDGTWRLGGFEPYEGTSHLCIDHFLNNQQNYLEVTESDLPYLKKPEGEWEFRKVESGDTFKGYRNKDKNIECHCPKLVRSLSGFRWCKPRKEGFEKWWDEEGLTMIPFGCDDMEDYAKNIAKVAWSNGAYRAKDEI